MTTNQAMNNPLVLALDIGTSSTRAMLFDHQGSAVPGLLAQTPYQLHLTPGGGVEGDADELVAIAAAAIASLLTQAGPLAARIAGVGVSCFWHSLMAVGPAGQALTPVYTWADDRSAAAVDALRAELDEAAMHDRTGCVLHTSYWPAKLRWLATTHPDLTAAGVRWVGYGDYLLAQLTGHLATSVAMASGTGLLNQHTANWDAPLLDFFQLSPTNLPPLIDRDEALPPLLPAWAQRWPALANAQWFPAVGDGACNNIGSGWRHAQAHRPQRRYFRRHANWPPCRWRHHPAGISGATASTVVASCSVAHSATAAWSWTGSAQRCNCPPMPPRRSPLSRLTATAWTILPFLAGQRTADWNPRATAIISGLTLEVSN